MQLDSPKDLFLYELSMIYDGEKRIIGLLDEASGAVDDGTLADMLRSHQQETRQQSRILDGCFEELGTSPQEVTCGPIEAMHKEYTEFVDSEPSPDVLAMFVMGGASKIEHFEIATYRGLIGKAMLMDKPHIAQELQGILVQEEATAGKVERYAHEFSQRILARTS